jgi:hypothetical protein
MFTFWVLQGKAQKPMDTDRPDQSENAHVLEPKELQVETGVLVNTYSEGKSSVIGSGLIRYSLIGGIEARILVEDGKGSKRFFKETAQGRFPASFSTKFGLLEKHKWLPDITLVSFLNLPFFSDTDENKLWAPAFVFALEKKLSKMTIEANAGIKWDAFKIGHNYQASASLNYELSDKWKLFNEYYGQYEQGERPMNNADAGLLFIINDNLQLDLAAGSQIFATHHNPFGTLGFSFRLPKK